MNQFFRNRVIKKISSLIQFAAYFCTALMTKYSVKNLRTNIFSTFMKFNNYRYQAFSFFYSNKYYYSMDSYIFVFKHTFSNNNTIKYLEENSEPITFHL